MCICDRIQGFILQGMDVVVMKMDITGLLDVWMVRMQDPLNNMQVDTITHPLDVLTTSGHRIGTAEIESALVAHSVVAEAAVIGSVVGGLFPKRANPMNANRFPHKVKGEGICCFVILIKGVESSDAVVAELRQQVRTVIGAFATPDLIVCTPGLPKVGHRMDCPWWSLI